VRNVAAWPSPPTSIPERVWRWGFVERVTTGRYLRWYGHARESATYLDTATLLAN